MHAQENGEAPSAQEVTQRGDDVSDRWPTTPVNVEGTVQVQVVPRRGRTSFRSLTLAPGEPIPVLGKSFLRAEATLICTTDDMWIGDSRAAVSGTPTNGALWPPSVPFTYTGTSPLWVCSTADPGTAQTLSIVAHHWED